MFLRVYYRSHFIPLAECAFAFFLFPHFEVRRRHSRGLSSGSSEPGCPAAFKLKLKRAPLQFSLLAELVFSPLPLVFGRRHFRRRAQTAAEDAKKTVRTALNEGDMKPRVTRESRIRALNACTLHAGIKTAVRATPAETMTVSEGNVPGGGCRTRANEVQAAEERKRALFFADAVAREHSALIGLQCQRPSPQ